MRHFPIKAEKHHLTSHKKAMPFNLYGVERHGLLHPGLLKAISLPYLI